MSVTNQTDLLVSDKSAVVTYLKPAAIVTYNKAAAAINYMLAGADVRTVLDGAELVYTNTRFVELVVATDIISKTIHICFTDTLEASDLTARYFAGLLNESSLNSVGMLTTELDAVPIQQIIIT